MFFREALGSCVHLRFGTSTLTLSVHFDVVLIHIQPTQRGCIRFEGALETVAGEHTLLNSRLQHFATGGERCSFGSFT